MAGGSDMLTTRLWFGHMGQKFYRNFFVISVDLDLPHNSPWKWKQIIFFLLKFWSHNVIQHCPQTCTGNLLVLGAIQV
jgi:hypothetical protein